MLLEWPTDPGGALGRAEAYARAGEAAHARHDLALARSLGADPARAAEIEARVGRSGG